MNIPGMGLVCVGLLHLATSLAGGGQVGAVGGCMPGSYLVLESSGTQSLWTFSSDGTFQVTSSAERGFNFSHIHGSWQREGAHSARGVALDFGFLPEPVRDGVPPEWITRIDVSMAFSRNCRQFAGGFELRFYGAAEDPLATPTTSPSANATFTGRRINVP